MVNKINFFETHIEGSARQNVLDVLSSTLLSEGRVVKDFESKLEKDLSVNNLVTVNSGTSALHLSLVLAGVGVGDEVILPAQTFVASGLAILMVGAKPVFCDIDYDSGNIAPKKIIELITPKTKAIMPVHWGGAPCDMAQISLIAKNHELVVIEDAAHALGARYNGVPIGSISDYTCFSFQAIKHLTTGDGGAICVKSADKYALAKRLRWFGLDRENSVVGELGEREYDIRELGYKYHLNDFSASLGIANLKGFFKRLERRKIIASEYDRAISKVNGITRFSRDDVADSSYWLYGLHVERRSDFISFLKSHGIPVSVVHQGIDRHSIFGGVNQGLVNQRRFDESQIHLPMHSGLTDEQVEFIIDAIKRGW